MERIHEISRDCFNALAQLRRTEGVTPLAPALLHERMRTLLERSMNRAMELGFSRQDIQEIGYALVAFTDEVVLSRGGPLRDFWLGRLLQLHYFNETIAGDNFFVRLDMLRQDPTKVDIVRVYYLCLLFGFRGRYRVQGGELEVERLLDMLGQDLMRSGAIKRDTNLSPSGARPDARTGGARRGLPVVLFGIVAVVLSIGLYGGMRLAIESQADDVVADIAEGQGLSVAPSAASPAAGGATASPGTGGTAQEPSR